jgi:hypothetical protein
MDESNDSISDKKSNVQNAINGFDIISQDIISHDIILENNALIINWLETLKKISLIYQYILDNSLYRANILLIISIIISFMLAFFSIFKFWVNDDKFQLISNIIILITKFTQCNYHNII